ncbi:transcriptional regulator domain-containing protein [Sphingomonas daechungensis]|uniref:transcriptional regulator domain-containing protein n=1 Tax=Sphingomonas daechungensis TaxID=1176646 RepID=UPI00349A835D
MSEDESWRSEAAYDYIEKLSPSDLAWEFLRRNPDYQKAYRDLVSAGRLTEDTARAFAEHWGLRFRRRSWQLCPSAAGILDPANGSLRADYRGRTKPRRRSQPPR